MKHICQCFSLLLITLVDFPRLGTLSNFFFCLEQDCTTLTLHDLPYFYVERATAHRIKINDQSCFHKRWQNSKTKLKLYDL